MIFTLTYDGPIPFSSAKAQAKHAIRRALHPQLKALWASPPLVERRAAIDPEATGDGAGALLRTVDNKSFATLVSDTYHLRANLRIRMLQRDPQGGALIHSGDIDNRLKTVFDALRRPQSPQEIPDSWTPKSDEQPLHCLLDDDRLITRVEVETTRWLEPGDPSELRLIIDVELWTHRVTWWTIEIV